MSRTLLIALATAVAVTALLALDLANPLELPLRDFAVRAMPRLPAAATVVVEIDERSLREIGPWPWPRTTLAQLVDRAAEANARAVILDILLADPRPGDDVLARAMTRVRTIAVSVLVEGEQWLVPAPALQKSALIAHGNFELDHDGIHRRFATTKQNDERSDVALSFEAAMHYPAFLTMLK
jgi:CHASE2 domain-containing sensor protein